MHAPQKYNYNQSPRQYLEKATAQTRPRSLAMADTISSRSPPPRYTPTINHHNSEQGHTQDEYDDYDDDYDEYEDYDYEDPTEFNHSTKQDQSSQESRITASRTITINIDSSISIHGHGNTVAIASPSPSSTSTSSDSARKNQNQADSSSSSPTHHYHQLPRSKLATTTAAIMAALQQSGILSQTQSQDSRRDSGSFSSNVEINIDAGVKVEGSRNTVCFGAVISGAGARTSREYSSRKRRAQSVSIHLPSSVILVFVFWADVT
ncbi:hypothetical protein BDV18DRAFT_149637 [Aspergillus unguis]